MKRKALAFLMSVVMVLTLASVSVSAQTASIPLDSASGWAREHIERAITLGLIPEHLQGHYTQATTRAEFTAFAVALYETATGLVITERMQFNDTDDINVQKMGGLGVVGGVGGGRFAPNDALTREQASTMLYRLANVLLDAEGTSWIEGWGSPHDPTFADTSAISDWALIAVTNMQNTGIMDGVGNNRFDPQGDYTREQSIVTILRLFDLVTAEGFGTTSVVDIIEFGGFDWRVLDVQDGRALIITDMIIKSRPYHGRWGEWDFVTWADSDLRAYLNGEFLDNFSCAEREQIVLTTNQNPDNPWFDTPGGVTTQDYVFLLSLDEVVKYFGDSGQLANQEHPNNGLWGFHDRFSDSRIAYHVGQSFPELDLVIEENEASVWWLRSPGIGMLHAAYVNSNGVVEVSGEFNFASLFGVRPALWLNL